MKYLILILFLVFGISFVSSTVVEALTVSPPRIEIFTKQGETFKGEILLYNEQLEIKTFYSSFQNFEAQGEEGAPAFTSEKEGVATWIEAPSEVTLKPGEQKYITYSVKVPNNIPDGGYFAAIFWGTSPPQLQAGVNVTIGAKIGILLLVRVGENIAEKGGLLEFGIENNKKFFTVLPITFFYRFGNQGGDRITPKGEIKIKNTIGLTAAKLSANPADGNVLPNSIRKFKTIWQKKDTVESSNDYGSGFLGMAKRQWHNFACGVYQAKLDINYGRTEIKTAKSAYWFVVFPWQLLLIIVLVATIVLFVLKKGIKRYNQWIINKVRK